ncbi:hypothetical protein Desor_3793 [Desulfosporosinus orientis DSM 765]|uniref:DUF5808 domain-containing protein n=1 Tax=Desulfosporosinus orientis (strain ATCC 19365 / DSM 765 / NCIMB 8382 / VKM B-1628 / Singapore I) TaxID=768706 RepID=G7W9B7_DESOD|nr:DUF5808 domain-containing protein [Desulfosporosinus orientis]AET69254.1 hypothetical protein Desor_3793 [Desulfosporosinus orientis DSM 765]
MNELFIRFGIIYTFLASLLIARPWLSRKNVLFGVVFGNGEIRKQETARKIINYFVLACLVIGIVLAAAFLLACKDLSQNEASLTKLFSAAFFALLLIDTVPYILANRAMKRLKATLQDENLVKGKILVEVGDAKLNKPVSPAWFLLLLLPIAAAVILALLYYPQLPETKSISLVMEPIFKQIVAAVFLFLIGFFSRIAPASVKGNPEAAPGYASFRRIVSLILIAVSLVIETKYLMAELNYLGFVSDLQTVTVVSKFLIIFLVGLLFVAFFLMVWRKNSSGPILDDDNKWVLGMIYVNPSDPSLFVEKRNGIGRTINFGRPAAWILMVALILFIIVRAFLRQ